MKKFKLINNIAGWAVFVIAATTYIMTCEPTASFWDCGEFITCGYKLEVSHPPGYPMFAMITRIAAMFAGGDPAKVPLAMNIYSGIASAFAVLFLFWIITHFALRIVGKKDEYSVKELITIIGSGAVGALAFTFSDSFWFSAVETIVFSSSTMFTAMIFWAMLKWEGCADQKYANRWLVLIAFLMGITIGIHLLNLLSIPALGLVYYFKKYKFSKRGLIITIIVSVILLAVVMFGIIQGVFVVASWFELLFVNSFGLPYNSGGAFFIVALMGSMVWGIWYTSKKGKALGNTILLCLTVLLLGYSSYAMTIIRSAAGTPLNENDPSNFFNIISYLSREQYGDRPLLYGPYYNAPAIDQKEGKTYWGQKDGKYVPIGHKPEYVYDSQFTTLFPRMWSPENNHVQGYKIWGEVKGTPVSMTNSQGEPQTIYKPTFGENLKFFFRYQIGWMYIRYFMWNFAGRQNDLQGTVGDNLRGNWISGIGFIDEMRLGPQDKLPESIDGHQIKNNHARNTYFMLPLLLGLFGFFYHLSRNKNDFWVVLGLFFMTGLAIVLYLNQKPFEPRERDYSYVGSFLTFSIWIGLGVMAVIDWISKKVPGKLTAGLVTAGCLVCVPGLMASQNWDDHNRSGRRTSTDFACDYLNSCEPNAIIFTNGDNDTFPLWCVQEVFGVRTDVRVVNLSYFAADWYVDQMARKVNNSAPLPFSMDHDKYKTGSRDALYIFDRVNGQYWDLKDVMKFVASDSLDTKTLANYNGRVDYLPAKNLSLKVDPKVILDNKVVREQDSSRIVPEMKWELTNGRSRDNKKSYRNAIYKNDMMVLDIIAHNDWKRPVYFAITTGEEPYLGMQKYFRLDGLAYRLVPVETNNEDGQIGYVDSKILYDKLMNQFKWGNMNDPKVYLDENNIRMLSNFRNDFARLAAQLNRENKTDSAVKVLDKSFEVMPLNQVPFNIVVVPLIEEYYKAKQPGKADALVTKFFDNLNIEAKYYLSLKGDLIKGVDYDKQVCLNTMYQLGRICETYGRKDQAAKIMTALQSYAQSMGFGQPQE